MKNRCLAVLWIVCLIPFSLFAKPLNPQDVPEPLKPWVGWVLHDNEQRVCPLLYNNADSRRCAWPSRLELNLDEQAGTFAASWQVDAESWVLLPGDSALWPQQVALDGKPVAVVSRDGNPAVLLPPGAHRLSGQFAWDRLPDNLAVPRDSGLIALTVKGKPVNPVFNEQGGLWLQGIQGPKREEIANTLNLRIFRRVVDGVPLRVVTHLDVEVAGEQREILLAGSVLPDAIPLELDSPLPTRLENDGRLRVQVRPGRWAVELISRAPGETAKLALPGQPTEPWPAEEVWSFEARAETRVVEVEGAPVVDPRQTEMPGGWKNLPAYRMQAGGVLAFKTLRRGDPESAPDNLSLHRTLWLDFDGGGYTVHDEISGELSRQWRLDVLPGLDLGQAQIDREPQLLTRMDGSAQTGVELRQGHVRLATDSRGEGSLRHLPATGWARDFQRVDATLKLPPGWRLFATTGVDNAPDTWIGRWTLLDFFMALIIALAVAMLRGRPGGAVAAAALILLWHEPDAPRYVWLHLLIAVALLRALPEGRAAWAVTQYRRLALLALLFIALPFMVAQVRQGIYPQLEFHGGFDARDFGAAGWTQTRKLGEMEDKAAKPMRQDAPASPPLPASIALEADEDRATGAGDDGKPSMPALSQKRQAYNNATLSAGAFKRKLSSADETQGSAQFRETDPDALTQTGPGLPQWSWTTLRLGWNGPVLANQEIGLFLIPPAVNLFLNLLRVALILALAWVLLGKGGADGKFHWKLPGLKSVGLVLLALLVVPTAKADMPSQELLGELKTRLLSPPECLPQCAQIAWMKLKFGADSLGEQMEIHALANVAVPLPAQEGQWLPTKASVDGATADTLFRAADGTLWLGLKAGRHEIVLAGALPAREQVQLALPLKPHRVEIEGGGWKVEGIKENGEPEWQLQLTRSLENGQAAPAEELEARPLPPFLELRRTLRLGLDWRVTTQVARISPADAPVVLEVPLLEGESVTTPGLQVKNGKLAVSLAPGQSELAWESSLEKRPQITLTAPQTTVWTEVWRADASPVWHLESSGIAPVRHQDDQGNRLPEWRPWPGESASLSLTRPKAAPGVTLTVDNSQLRLSPGLRATDATLTVTLRSSQGRQHTVKLPEGAALQSVSIDGAAQPIRQQGLAVTLPIHPGAQTLTLTWRQASGIAMFFAAPTVDLGVPSVNSSVTVDLSRDRWVLLTYGPKLGPAVLFWGLLVVLAVLAYGLGKLDWTPLKAGHWFLLLLGLSQVELLTAVCVVAWLFALGWRGRRGAELNTIRFNAAQLGLALLTPIALSCLFYAVQHGLLGLPDMQVAGNNSSAFNLNWYQDRSPGLLPRPWLVSAPLWTYRALMLLWALWLAHSLLNWLRWGFGCFMAGGLWRTWKPAIAPDDDKPD